ncbi:hypothetical protein [Nonomuraea gerenzanensis]|uniref:Uncharacterized protein n=1 Tax=Nonomuraea gerenzanensis TaxID=93944 RepID=A0A1M4E5X4_9ACTN|nr:hypothetical protein [Nonomuraea gerenzanensis]UBU16431.1 hypothetical protein LCN96_15875 [Nonomuraea gerenzanensis]SBO94255.1 hypothetical protein BN4615_P3771 [Nonomuraea gerenzanensis]
MNGMTPVGLTAHNHDDDTSSAAPSSENLEADPENPLLATDNGTEPFPRETEVAPGAFDDVAPDTSPAETDEGTTPASKEAEAITGVSVVVDGEGNTTFAAWMQGFHYYSGDHVEPTPVPDRDLAACAEGRFVPPASGWEDAATTLASQGIVVLLAPAGSGRRTAALRLLSDRCNGSVLCDLETAWQRPNVKCLQNVPAGAGGYLLDMSEPAEKTPKKGFGVALVQWAAQRKRQGTYLVVITTESAWSGPWADEAIDVVVALGSPDAKTLVKRELTQHKAAHRSGMVDDHRLQPIWDSNPSAEDACQLAKKIAASRDADPQPIVDEYTGWTSWFTDFPDKLHARVVLWAGALCDGGRRESVLRMSDALIELLGDDRSPAEILGGAISSKRFDAAHLKETGDRVQLPPDKHGLPSAVLRHFWREFPTQQKRFVGWATNQAAELPVDDAERVADALVELGAHHRAGEVFKQLRDTLAPRRRALAVRALSAAALDKRSGPYVRGRLYTWLYDSPAQGVIDLVAEVCGGTFGTKMPLRALARLRLAGEHSAFGSLPVAQAWVSLTETHPTYVRTAVTSWLTGDRYPRAGLVAFMALASTSVGSVLLFGEDGRDLEVESTQTMIVNCLRQALGEPEAIAAADTIIQNWAAQADEGSLPRRVVVDMLGAVFTGDRYQDIKRFLSQEKLPDPGTLWHEILTKALLPTGSREPASETAARAE